MLCSKSLSSAWKMMPGRILCYVVMIIQWVVVYQSNKTTIVVISAHARFVSAMPVLLLGWVFACYGPSAVYLAVKILPRISVSGISMVSCLSCLSSSCSGRWLVGPFRTSNKLNKLFYLTRPQLALRKSLPFSYNDR